jgi:hypothetical protein
MFVVEQRSILGSGQATLGMDGLIVREPSCSCSSRIKLRTPNHHFMSRRRYFGRNKVADWNNSHFCQKFLTKNKVVDSNSVYLLQKSKQNES